MYDPCEPTFAVERAYLAGKDVYTYLNATTRIHLVWRQGQHHGFELIDSYMDMFDYALGRGTFTRNDFPEVRSALILIFTLKYAAQIFT